MSRKLPNLGWREIIKALRKRGFYVTHQRGSHIYLTDETRLHKVTIPRHDSVKAGTLLSIIEQSGMTKEEFLSFFD